MGGDVRQSTLEDAVPEMVYFPTLTEVAGNFQVSRAQDLVVRTSGDPLAFLPVFCRELHALNPRIPLDQRGILVMSQVPTPSRARVEVEDPSGAAVRTFSLVDGPSVVVITFPLPGLRVP